MNKIAAFFVFIFCVSLHASYRPEKGSLKRRVPLQEIQIPNKTGSCPKKSLLMHIVTTPNCNWLRRIQGCYLSSNSINEIDEKGRTVLLNAYQKGLLACNNGLITWEHYQAVTKLLQDAGGNPQIADRTGTTPASYMQQINKQLIKRF